MRKPHVAAARLAGALLAASLAGCAPEGDAGKALGEAQGVAGAAAGAAGTAQACIIDGEGWGYRLGPYLAFLEDPTGELGPAGALSPEKAASYVSRAAETISLGYSKSAFWFKGEARNESGRNLDCVLVLKEPAIENVELFLRGERLRSGAVLHVEERAVPSRVSAFEVRLPAGETVELLLRVRTDTSINLSFVLFEEKAFRRREAAGIFIVSLCFGALFFAVAYNPFLAVSLRVP
ncbi:MAG: 7TM-DISM domain-containing protein, partial [Spirochaetaceae bacterium]|nr:7TM-DISM domain-containing protein [Spirochaetaceae bacterium]